MVLIIFDPLFTFFSHQGKDTNIHSAHSLLRAETTTPEGIRNNAPNPLLSTIDRILGLLGAIFFPYPFLDLEFVYLFFFSL